jgi:hypothetical protein
MDGSAAESRLRAAARNIDCLRASPADDADLRALLRGNPMGGWISIAMAREPSFFAPLIAGEDHQAIIARDTATGNAIGMCARTVRQAYVGGEAQPLGYIGELRIAASHRHRFHIVRQGFETLRAELHEPERTPYYLTAIVDDNATARRLLEANLPGKPVYRPLAACTTLALRTRSGAVDPAAHARPDEIAAVADCLARNHRRYLFAPVWSADDLRHAPERGGPGIGDFLVHRRAGSIAGCLALWDQTRVRQAIVHGYRAPIAKLRPWLNLLGGLTGLPTLPPQGTALRQVYLSFPAIDGEDPAILCALVQAGLREARRRGFDLALLTLAAENPMLPALRQAFRARDYAGRLYLVHWPEGRAAVEDLPGGIVHVEAGLL